MDGGRILCHPSDWAATIMHLAVSLNQTSKLSSADADAQHATQFR